MKVYLSQCMIVKNEERNIRTALSWAKEIAFEQIVVDTGSTDRTVQIAEEMGAKVFHFKWIDDFSAAKNYAIKQASGNWIAFLDADEYMESDAARKLLQILKQIEKQPKTSQRPNVIRQPWIQLNDTGKMFASSVQDRVFRNAGIFYKNKIHENLVSTSLHFPLIVCSVGMELPIYHTGYTQEAYARTKKATRNIELLKQELKEDPENYMNWRYLGDAYVLEGKLEEGINAWKRCAEAPETFSISRRLSAANSLMRVYFYLNRDEELQQLYATFKKYKVNNADLEYWMGCCYLRNKKYEDVIVHFANALHQLECVNSTDMCYCSSKLLEIYTDLITACEICNRISDAVRFAALSLNMKNRQEKVLITLLRIFQNHGEKAANVFSFLEKLYHFQDTRDVLFVLKCTRLASFPALEPFLISRLSEKERQELFSSSLRDAWQFLREQVPQLSIQNQQDAQFAHLISFLKQKSDKELLSNLKLRLEKLKEQSSKNYTNYCNFYKALPFWGTFNPENNNWNTFQHRIGALKGLWKEWIHLYQILSDSRSRQTLIALLENLINLNYDLPLQVKDYSLPYLDLDRFPSSENAIFVDVGAYKGATIRRFLSLYGETYRRIYAYECNSNLLGELEENLRSWDNIVLSTSAVGRQKDHAELVLCSENDNATSLWLSNGEKGSIPVVPLDEDIKESISLLKINVCGMENDVLLGAQRHIRDDRPVIAVAAFYQYDALLTLSRTIREIEPGYQFYLRHYGENLIMTDYVLYAICPEQTETDIQPNQIRDKGESL